MVACALDKEVSGEVLGLKLPAWQALLLHRVLPSCGGFVIYLTVMCFDIAVIYEHYQNMETGLGAFSIILMVLPALISFVFTLASPPPGLQTELSAFTVNINKKEWKWIGMQFVNCLFFPIAAIGRYCHQIFWWVEAVCASRVQDEKRTADALSHARAPSPLELYLFLQAFIHSAPTVIVNILDLMGGHRDPAFDKVSVQAVSIVAATLRMASTATTYRRFEREKICGRKYPWMTKKKPDNGKKPDDGKNPGNGQKPDDVNFNNVQANLNKIEEEPVYEAISSRQPFLVQRTSESDRNTANSNMIEFSPSPQQEEPWFYDDSDSGNSSTYMPPEGGSRASRKISQSSDDAYIRPISIIDRVAPRRRDGMEPAVTIERVEIVPPPAFPAPRPMSLAVWAEKIVENAESIPGWLSAPHRSKYIEQLNEPEPELPRRIPRSYIRGLEPQDATAALVQYLGWYSFFVSRLLSIAAFINCVPVAAIIVLFSHYQVMLLLLIVPQASTVRRAFYIFLAFVYLFCLMEFKIRFRHVRVWHVFWIVVCTVEAIVFTALWSVIGNDMGNWWTMFVVRVILGSLLLSYMCFLVYFVLLKPRETLVRINRTSNSVK